MNILNEAIIFSTNAHNGQERKYSKLPYIIHPLEVAAIIATMTTDQEIMAAGLLHDTIEDCGVMPETIQEKFGDRVLNLVKSETEEKMRDRSPEDTWMERKEKSLKDLKESTDLGVKMLWLADKLSNTRSFCREYAVKGVSIWEQLHQKDVQLQEWYYRKIVEYLAELSNYDAYKEYVNRVEYLFGGGKEV